MKVNTVDDTCKSMKRERTFKVYLNNPSMRAALFAPVDIEDSESIGHLAESAIFSQWQHSSGYRFLRYARWRNEGEVDIVCLDQAMQQPIWIGEIKWSDRIANNENSATKWLKVLLSKNLSIINGFITSRTVAKTIELHGRRFDVIPCAMYCYTVGRNITTNLDLSKAT